MEREIERRMPAQLDLLRDEVAGLRVESWQALCRFKQSQDLRDLLESVNLRLEAEAIVQAAKRPGRWGG